MASMTWVRNIVEWPLKTSLHALTPVYSMTSAGFS